MALAPSARSREIPQSTLRRLFDASLPSTINLGPGDPSIPIELGLLDAGVARYRAVRGGYTLNAGLLPLRERIVEYYRYPQFAKPSNVVITAGATGGLFAALMAIGDPGDEVIVSDPSFFNYPVTIRMLGMVPKAVPRKIDAGFDLDVDAVLRAIGPRTRAILLNSPSNPTGRVDAKERLAELVAATEGRDVWLLSDEIYNEIYFTEERPASVASMAPDRAIVVNALSKTCSMTGFRLGYVMAPDAIARQIALVHQYNVTCAPNVSQYIALEAFEHPERWLLQSRAPYLAQRNTLLRAVDERLGLPHSPCEGGFFLFVDCRSLRMPSLELAQRLLAEADVLVIPGAAFGPGGEGFLRISITASEGDIKEGIARIRRFIDEKGLL